MAIPKGREPTGVILVDKPAGPSSFAVLAGVRSRTGAKTGHAGTLDPFATGLLLLLSGRATTISSCFVGLPKRYRTDVDLSQRTTTGDPEGEPLEHHEPPTAGQLESELAALRGEVELPIPTASAVKIGGERAYRLHRRGVAVEMPLRRSQVDALEVIAYTEGIVTLDLRVSSGTYVRSIADALGGHCVALRRTEVGPFTVEEADAERVLTLEDALGRIGLTVAEAEAERRRKSLSDREAHRRRQAHEQSQEQSIEQAVEQAQAQAHRAHGDREHDDRVPDGKHAEDGNAPAEPGHRRPGARPADAGEGESRPDRGGERPAAGPGSGPGGPGGTGGTGGPGGAGR